MEIHVYPSNEFAYFWPISSFNEKYSEDDGIRKSVVLSAFDLASPNKVSVIILRSFIQRSERAKSDQKYIIGIRFYSFGDMATIDLISLDKDFHREICCDHLKNMNWPLWSENMGSKVDHYDETTRSPLMFAGAHLQIGQDESLNFFSSSGDYGDKLLFSNSNSLANYIASFFNLKITGDKESGEELVKYLLKFMYENKLKRDFYQKLVASLYARKDELNITSQHIGAFIAMKVMDRHILGEGSILGLTVDEMSEGIMRDFMLQSIARKMRSSED